MAMGRFMITLTREEAQQVLGALKETWYHVGTFAPTEQAVYSYDKAIELLRTKLSEPEPEPVTTQYKYIDAFGNDYWTDEPWQGKKVEAERYLYATPSQRELVGLTGQETNHLLAANVDCAEKLIRAIEAKLKEKNSV